jgi:hypothetical protein
MILDLLASKPDGVHFCVAGRVILLCGLIDGPD